MRFPAAQAALAWLALAGPHVPGPATSLEPPELEGFPAPPNGEPRSNGGWVQTEQAELDGGCAFDVVDAIDSARFEREYRGRKPLLVRQPNAPALLTLQALFGKEVPTKIVSCKFSRFFLILIE
jgi:hypothetical protein